MIAKQKSTSLNLRIYAQNAKFPAIVIAREFRVGGILAAIHRAKAQI